MTFFIYAQAFLLHQELLKLNSYPELQKNLAYLKKYKMKINKMMKIFRISVLYYPLRGKHLKHCNSCGHTSAKTM